MGVCPILHRSRNVIQRIYVMTEGSVITEEWLPVNAPTRVVRRPCPSPVAHAQPPATASRPARDRT